ncbi:hypothetical protein RI367_004443 [Sorochytrium milnesiophthora]
MPSYAPPVVCVAIVGKQSNPLYIRSFDASPHTTATTENRQLRYHFVAHTACDFVEERLTAAGSGRGPGLSGGSSSSTDMYLGLLYSLEDLAVYGYITNTRIKFFVIVSTSSTASHSRPTVLRDAEVKQIFNQLHIAYIQLVSNPFYDPDSSDMISSNRFAQLVDHIILGASDSGRPLAAGRSATPASFTSTASASPNRPPRPASSSAPHDDDDVPLSRIVSPTAAASVVPAEGVVADI